MTEQDQTSLGNPQEIRVTHLEWSVNVDFEATIFRATATYQMERVNAKANVLNLDTSHLMIESVSNPEDGSALQYKLVKNEKEHLGTQLSILLPPGAKRVAIAYRTTTASSAIQWLPPSQTAGKRHPYLFTQCQAIHARSMLPCQDQPGVKMTFDAHVTVPSWAVSVMSGVLVRKDEAADVSVFHWTQKVPVSSYLIAMAVGEITKKDISDRCAIWSEPALVDVAADEFAQSEEFLQIAETIAGTPYVWGRYDLLCLPPSFPYGGMENPCLTFVTPTLLARDRSLADVVAHEIAHSWTGNLVTNATWDHFWLNEGWTTWFQRKIMARIHNDDRFLDFDAIGGYKTLQDTMKEMPTQYQSLVLPIGDNDPDDAYSSVAYEKGFNFLYSLEKRVGKASFESFFQAYVKSFASKTLTSEDFKDFFLEHFKGNSAVAGIQWDKWFYEPGMPPEVPTFDRTLSEASEKLAEEWVDVDQKFAPEPKTDIKGWTSPQITCFLDSLQARTASKPLKLSTLKAMDDQYNFSQSQNAEILFRFCEVRLCKYLLAIIRIYLNNKSNTVSVQDFNRIGRSKHANGDCLFHHVAR
jgi:leukotriene-A4 hydrolase